MTKGPATARWAPGSPSGALTCLPKPHTSRARQAHSHTPLSLLTDPQPRRAQAARGMLRRRSKMGPEQCCQLRVTGERLTPAAPGEIPCWGAPLGASRLAGPCRPYPCGPLGRAAVERQRRGSGAAGRGRHRRCGAVEAPGAAARRCGASPPFPSKTAPGRAWRICGQRPAAAPASVSPGKDSGRVWTAVARGCCGGAGVPRRGGASARPCRRGAVSNLRAAPRPRSVTHSRPSVWGALGALPSRRGEWAGSARRDGSN